jgi:hypothetical protein
MARHGEGMTVIASRAERAAVHKLVAVACRGGFWRSITWD